MQGSGPYSSQPVIGLVCNGVIIMLGWTYLQVRSDTFLAIYSVKFWFRSLEMYQKVFIKRRIFLRFFYLDITPRVSLWNVQCAKGNKWLSCRILDLFLYKVVYCCMTLDRIKKGKITPKQMLIFQSKNALCLENVLFKTLFSQFSNFIFLWWMSKVDIDCFWKNWRYYP